MTFDPRNILIIDFGQLGDVVMSLPALRAIRENFPFARITIAVGKPGAEIINMSGHADATIEVDRVALRDGFKPLSVWKILQLVKDVRRRQFDFVIDLHSLAETNILGFVSGAPKRLFSRRPGRSLDFLARFDSQPPIDRNDPNEHQTDRYLAVLRPLGIEIVEREPQLRPRPEDNREVDRLLQQARATAPMVGLYPGAGHASRKWPLERFAQLAEYLTRNDEVCIIVFAGPEEREMLPQMRAIFPPSTLLFDKLTIRQLLAAEARLSVFVSNDTGPMHLAAAAGTPFVALFDHRAPNTYVPVNEPKRVLKQRPLADLTVEEVYDATRELLTNGRVESLFAS